jgi:caffeoyl-CoA O-methyltransferase
MSTSIGLSPQVSDYVQAWGVRDHPVLRRCREETARLRNAGMQISPEQGAVMQVLIRATGARRILEVGVFTGYSSTAMALALQALHGADAELVACDISEEFVARARTAWREAGVEQLISVRIAPAEQSLRALIAEGRSGAFDMMFIDADKTGYDAYYELGLTLLRPGGLMLIDNVLWSGAVADPTNTSPDTRALRDLAHKIHGDERVDMTLATIGDGLSMVVKR